MNELVHALRQLKERATVPDMSYLVISGRAVLVGKQPDGDSIRFIPDEPALFSRLENGQRVDPSADGSVQLRLDGIDAPELHYAGAAQPQGAAARDALLARLGFTDLAYAADGDTVTAATPVTVPLVILSRLVEVNGRPVSVVFSGQSAAALGPSSGTEADLSSDLLTESVNVWEAANGISYPLVYTSTPPALRAAFTSAGRAARDARAGVWAADSTSSFSVADSAALDPTGDLIWPKLFRRATDYIRSRLPGQTLPQWLADTPDQDDEIHVGSALQPVPLHTLLTQTGTQAALTVDLLDLTVVER